MERKHSHDERCRLEEERDERLGGRGRERWDKGGERERGRGREREGGTNAPAGCLMEVSRFVSRFFPVFFCVPLNGGFHVTGEASGDPRGILLM